MNFLKGPGLVSTSRLHCAQYYHLTTQPWIAYNASTGSLPIFKLQQLVYSRARETQISYSHHKRTRGILQYINPAMKIYPELTRELILYTSLLYYISILFAWKRTYNSQPCSLHIQVLITVSASNLQTNSPTSVTAKLEGKPQECICNLGKEEFPPISKNTVVDCHITFWP